VPGRPQRVGLAGPRPPDHHPHPGAVQAHVADHPRLVLPQRRVRGQGLADGLGRDQARPLAGAVNCRGDQAPLHPEQLWRRPAALLHGPVGHHADRPLAQEPARQALQLLAGRAD
jgi:hypothetical protein